MSRIPISISKVNVDLETQKKITKVLQSGMLVWGKNVGELEHKFAGLSGVDHAVAVTSGSTALHTALMVLGVGSGDEVITTPFTYVATANAICLTGAKPVFVDIDPKTYNLNPNQIEAAITPKTKAILTVDLYGLPADYSPINRIAKKNHLKVIEDAAQAVGALYKNKPTGSLAQVGCFSLYATKNLMSGEGGMITTKSKSLETKARRFRNHGEAHGLNYIYHGLGTNYCPTEIMAVLALGQLSDFKKRTKRRQQIAQSYTKAFKEIPGLITPETPSYASHVFHQYTLRITNDFPLSRLVFAKKLFAKGITTRIYYPQSLDQIPHLNPTRHKYQLREAKKAAREVISIPVHPYLTDNEVEYIIKTIYEITKS